MSDWRHIDVDKTTNGCVWIELMQFYMTAEEKISNLGKYLVRVMNESFGNRFSSDLEM